MQIFKIENNTNGKITAQYHFSDMIFVLALFCFLLPIFSFALTIGGQTINFGGDTLKQGLVGHWTFDGSDIVSNVQDKSGNGNTGYMSGFTSTTSAKVIGKLGQALKFDGVDDYVSVPSNSSLDTAGNFTATLWFKAPNENQTKVLLSRRNPNAPYNQWGIVINDFNCVNGGVGKQICVFLGENYPFSYKSFYTNDNVVDGTWKHLAVVSNRTASTFKIYVNGSEVSVSTFAEGGSYPNPDASQPLRIANNNATNYYSGLIDDVRYYNRPLSASEIKKIYNQGGSKLNSQTVNSGGDTLKQGLIGHWTFDGSDIVSNVQDKSGNGNTGYMLGFTSTSSAKTIGKLGQALKFDGSNDYVDFGDINSMDGLSAHTVCAWVKLNNTNTNQNIASKYLTSGLFFQVGSSARIAYGFNSSSFVYSPTNSVVARKWQHWCGTFNHALGTGKHKIYLDGVSQVVTNNSTPDSVTTTGSNSESFQVNKLNALNRWLGGTIDDVRVWGRALNSDEIKQVYNQGGSKLTSQTTNSGGDTLKQGLVGHWTFDGSDIVSNVQDKSGNGNTGYMSGFTSTTSAKVIGKLGQALKFDGVDDYVVAKDIINVSNVTISAWVKLNAYPSCCSNLGGLIVGFMEGIGSSTNDKELYVSSLDGKLYFYIWDGSTKYTSAPANALPLNKWTHVVGTSDGSYIKTYVDGVEVGSTAAGSSFAGYTVPNVFIRGYSANISQKLHQSIDDVRIYNRALSALEIKQIYNMGR